MQRHIRRTSVRLDHGWVQALAAIVLAGGLLAAAPVARATAALPKAEAAVTLPSAGESVPGVPDHGVVDGVVAAGAPAGLRQAVSG